MTRLPVAAALMSLMGLPVLSAEPTTSGRETVPTQVPTVFINTGAIKAGERIRFGAYEDNYVLYHRMRNNGWADSDEAALRAHFSLRYVLAATHNWSAFFSYTGEFDFYWRTRPSGPVINRLSNPALRVQWNAKEFIGKAAEGDYMELALEHASDGQVNEVTGAAEAAVAQRAYDERYRPYFDQVSRGSNFFSVGTRLSEAATGLPVVVHAKARLYVNQSSEVTWGPLAGQGARLSDYNRFNVRIGKSLPDIGTFEALWTVGDKGLKTDSLELAWQWPEGKGWKLPLYVRYRHGPLNTLSNYTQRQDSVGIGVRFAPF